MMRLMSVTILLAFLVASTHGVVDHGVAGHKSFVLLSHDESVPDQHHSHHPPGHSTHHQDMADLHLASTDAHDPDVHTHFTLAPCSRSGFTDVSRLLALTPLIWVADTTSVQIPFVRDGPSGRYLHSPPLYLHYRTLLI